MLISLHYAAKIANVSIPIWEMWVHSFQDMKKTFDACRVTIGIGRLQR
jgi:hypothetical protein